MLTALLDGWFKMDVGDGAFYMVFGLLFVILGITLLVCILMGVGKIMQIVNAKKKTKETTPVKAAPVKETAVEEGVSPEVVAAITAALMAYYEQENVKCDFVVRRIKRI